MIGYGSIQKTPNDVNADLYIAVLPTFRRRGIGSQLFTRLLERASELDAQALRTYVNVRNKEADLFVREHDFEPVSTYTRLSVPATQTFPTPALPRGFTIRSYDQIERVDLYTQALNRCYEGQWGHLHVTEEDIAPSLAQLNHSGNFLLFAPDGSIAGFCRADLSDSDGSESELTALIDAPGIVPEYRAANLVLPLLLTVIHWLLPQGLATLELEAWGDTPATIALYRSLGFQPIKEEISYRRDM